MKTILTLVTSVIFAGRLCSVSLAAQFTDVTSSTGLVQVEQKTWGNPVWGDINNDGYLDLIVPDHGLAVSKGPFVYLNNGGQSFIDIRTTSGIRRGPELDDGDWHGYAFGDYDNDGNLDLYIAEGAKGQQGGTTKRDLLFRGHGDGTFEYASDTAGVETSMNRGRCGYWLDYDNDSHLDLFVKNVTGYNVLYKGDGNGTLTPVPNAGGLADATSGLNLGSIMSFADYDNDGFMDLIITGDGNAQALYHNQGDGTFIDATTAAGMVPLTDGKGVAWGDYNNDGLMDLLIARGEQGSRESGVTLYRNNGDGTFIDRTSSAGLDFIATCWAVLWGDYDNDGFLDFFATNSAVLGEGQSNPNFLYHNNGDGTFTNMAADAGVAMEDGVEVHKGAAWADYDNDGFLDLLVKDGLGNEGDEGAGAKGLHFLFRNNGNTNHFIKINLKGVQSNGQGIGARVTVTSSNGMSYRQNNGGGGGEQASEGSEPLHFGIGSAVDATVEVKWPSGTVDTMTQVAANSTLDIVEGSAENAIPPGIIRQPRNRSVIEGKTARFSVIVTGDEPLTYQWRKNGADIAGAIDAVYATPPVTLEDHGSAFSVTVTNPGGSVTSRDAKLGVTPK